MSTNDPTVQVPEPPLEAIDADGPAALAREVERIVTDHNTKRPATAWAPQDHVLAEILRPGDQLVIRDLEQYEPQPVAPRGTTVVYDAPSFTRLVQRHADARTTLWARQPATGATIPSVTAVFDDHTDANTAGWREHRAQLKVRMDPDWVAWSQVDKKPMDQIQLAEFLTDQLHTIAQPRAAELIPAVSTFSTKRNVTFSQGINLDTGETQFTYVDQRGETAGTETLPNKLTLNVRPFYGSSVAALEVWLRYRITEGKLRFTLERIRPDRAEEAAWGDMCDEIAAGLGEDLPIWQGTAPDPLR
jgi:uncharacterized protein YfdQ (DUF2303 family)